MLTAHTHTDYLSHTLCVNRFVKWQVSARALALLYELGRQGQCMRAPGLATPASPLSPLPSTYSHSDTERACASERERERVDTPVAAAPSWSSSSRWAFPTRSFSSQRARARSSTPSSSSRPSGGVCIRIYMYIPTVLQLQAAHVHERRAARGSRETIDSPLYSLSLLYCTHRQRLCVALYIAARARAAEKELCALVNATRENVVSLCLFFLSDPFFAAF